MRFHRVLAILGLFVAAALLRAAEASAPAAPKVGDMAPVFSLMSDEGKPVNLADYRGRWVVLYFYPKDFTSGCTLEAHNFQQDLPRYQANNAVIVGVSLDTPDSHKSFCEKEGLGFRLLSDPGAKVSTAYGSVMEHEGQTYSARNTFLIDPKGKIAKVYTGVKPATHSREVLDTIATLSAK
jgi:peroxiredoxin Q/BCP